MTQLLNEKKIEEEQVVETRVPARGLEGAYGEDEPEYTLDILIAANPDYKGSPEKCNLTSHLPARDLEGAYDDDEPEYTLDMLISTS